MIKDIIKESIASGLKNGIEEEGQIYPELFLDNV